MSKLQKFVWIKSSKWPRQLFVHAVHLLSGLCCSAASQSVISTHTEILSSALAPEVGQVCTKLYNMLSRQNSKTASAHTHKHTRTRSALQSKWEPGIQISEFQMQLDSPLCLSSYTPPHPPNPASQCLCVSMTTTWNYYIISKKGAAVEFCTHAHKLEQFLHPLPKMLPHPLLKTLLHKVFFFRRCGIITW